jgi:cell division protein FtsL
MQATEMHPDQRWRNRTVHREIDARKMRRVWKLILAFVVAVTPTAAYLVQLNESVKLGYQVDRVEDERERLRVAKQRLILERARLESLTRIEDWAVRGHGLVRPGPDSVVMVREPSDGSGSLLAASPGKGSPPIR